MFETGFDADMSGDKNRYDKTDKLRFWMKKGTEKTIIFLDVVPSSLWEHRVRVGGPRGSNFNSTCMCHVHKVCPNCAINQWRAKISVFTVIDTESYVIKKGKRAGEKVDFTRKLFVATQDVFEKIKRLEARLKEKGKSLNGALVTVSRGTGEKTPRTGDDFNYEDHFDLTELPANCKSEPFDYNELLAPDIVIAQSVADKFAAQEASGANNDWNNSAGNSKTPEVKYT